MEGKPFVVFVLGGPGAGKGTQSQLLSKEYGFIHLSAGDLLREEAQSKSETGEMINTYIREGKIVPVDVTVGLLKKGMEKHGWEKAKFLIDGFPRNKDNVDGWNRVIGDQAYFHTLLCFECTFETLEKRLLERGKASGRIDDNIEAIKKRFTTFVAETKPVIEHFEEQNKVVKIDSEKSVEEVFEQLKKVFDPLFKPNK